MIFNEPLLVDMTSPYNRFEAWFFDTFLAPALMEFKDAVSERLIEEVPENGRLLDVGSGGGYTLRYIGSNRPDLHLVGLDLSFPQVRRLKNRSEDFDARTSAVQGNGMSLPFPDESFESLICIATLKHFPDQTRALEEFARVLKPGCTLTLVEAARESTDNEINRFVNEFWFPGFLTPILARGFRKFVIRQSPSVESVKDRFEDVDFRDLTVKKIDGLPGLKVVGTK